MIYQLKPNANSCGKTGEPEMIDICDGGAVWCSVHIDMFWSSAAKHDPQSVYSRLRRGEEVEVALAVEARSGKAAQA